MKRNILTLLSLCHLSLACGLSACSGSTNNQLLDQIEEAMAANDTALVDELVLKLDYSKMTSDQTLRAHDVFMWLNFPEDVDAPALDLPDGHEEEMDRGAETSDE